MLLTPGGKIFPSQHYKPMQTPTRTKTTSTASFGMKCMRNSLCTTGP